MENKPKLFIGSDYHGFEKKRALVEFFVNSFDVSDEGDYGDTEDDYNDPAIAVSKAVKENLGSFGILICGSAHGMCIQANRFKDIRAINALSEESAKLGREHDDANILCLSAELTDLETMKKIADTFLNTPFEPIERRVRRINRLDEEVYD